MSINGAECFRAKKVLVTGCCGTMGSELIRLLLSMPDGPVEVIGIDNNESGIFVQGLRHSSDGRAHFFLCDLRDARSLSDIMPGIDIVLHGAALKHVSICERSPMQALEANVIGLQNVINAANDNNVELLISMSSDKAVNPNSVMGMTKLMGERLISAANASKRSSRTIFSSTRFGNVIGSNGSVFHIFREQIAAGGPVTLTHLDMTRFIMSTKEAAELVLMSASIARGGEVFVVRTMPVIRIADLAVAMIEALAPRFGRAIEDIKISEVGALIGEKYYEQLLSEEECARAVEFGEFIAIKPAFLGYQKDTAYHYGGPAASPAVAVLRSDQGPFLPVAGIVAKLRHWELV